MLEKKVRVLTLKELIGLCLCVFWKRLNRKSERHREADAKWKSEASEERLLRRGKYLEGLKNCRGNVFIRRGKISISFSIFWKRILDISLLSIWCLKTHLTSVMNFSMLKTLITSVVFETNVKKVMSIDYFLVVCASFW